MQKELYVAPVAAAEPLTSPLRDETLLLYMTHELRCALGPLHRSVDFMLQRARSVGGDETLLEQLGVLLRQVERSELLVERQEAYAWLNQPGSVVHSRSVNLTQLAAEVAADFGLAYPDLSITLEAPLPVTLKADPLHLGQVLYNLLTHAVHNSPSGGGITVRVWQEQGRAYCAIADDGPAWEYDDDMASQPLRRLRDTNERSARVGLAICNAIVQRYGGLLLRSSGRRGHEVRFWLPLKAES